MSLNATIFPALDPPVLSIDFSRLVLGPAGSSADLLRRRMGIYVDLLDAELGPSAAWQRPRRIVVGHSFGGMLALTWWLAHAGSGPARIDRMVLCSTTAGPLFRAARIAGFPLAPLMPVWNRPGVTRALKRVICGRLDLVETVDFQAIPRRSDLAVDLMGWRNTDWRAMRSYRLALDGFDLRARLGEITVPVIVLHGERDPILPPALGRELADRLPHGEFRLVKGAGHSLPLTHGAAVREALAGL
jgi:pimeloyl-ACP methyl ester carboxylesterase